jgi:hypothetical protein
MPRSSIFPSDFLTEASNEFLILPVCATCPAHHIFLELN